MPVRNAFIRSWFGLRWYLFKSIPSRRDRSLRRKRCPTKQSPHRRCGTIEYDKKICRLGSIPTAWKSRWGYRFLRSDRSLRDGMVGGCRFLRSDRSLRDGMVGGIVFYIAIDPFGMVWWGGIVFYIAIDPFGMVRWGCRFLRSDRSLRDGMDIYKYHLTPKVITDKCVPYISLGGLPLFFFVLSSSSTLFFDLIRSKQP